MFVDASVALKSDEQLELATMQALSRLASEVEAVGRRSAGCGKTRAGSGSGMDIHEARCCGGGVCETACIRCGGSDHGAWGEELCHGVGCGDRGEFIEREARITGETLTWTEYSSRPRTASWASPTATLGAISRIDGTQIDVKMDGEKERAGQLRFCEDAALRSWLRRDLAQLPRSDYRPRIGEHGHDRSPRTHQHPLRLCLRLPRFAGRAGFIPTMPEILVNASVPT